MVAKFISAQIEDRQENIIVAQSDGMILVMIAPIQESDTSIKIIPFRDDIVRVTIRQEGQLIMFADATTY